jgi:antitoxin ParD1/3/4
MAKNTSILLGDYFDNFISKQVETGRFNSVSEVIRTALRVFEKHETKKSELNKELEIGEKSGLIEYFDRDEFIKNLHKEHLNNDL